MFDSAKLSNDALSLCEPAQRRWWLLCKALECTPLDRALDLARTAEEFVTGAPIAPHLSETAAGAMMAPHDTHQSPSNSDTDRSQARAVARHRRVTLSAEQREDLLDRLARDARNGEIAADLGLSKKQVQGIRMGSAREIERRRAQSRDGESERSAEPAHAFPASVDEVVRYLRQQDDVVVPQPDGGFLVNSRFRLSFAELIGRANRMRSRQKKPEFRADTDPAEPKLGPQLVNGHGCSVREVTLRHP